MREWAGKNGFDVSPRGRIKAASSMHSTPHTETGEQHLSLIVSASPICLPCDRRLVGERYIFCSSSFSSSSESRWDAATGRRSHVAGPCDEPRMKCPDVDGENIVAVPRMFGRRSFR
ncbi:Lsr2 family DNA-binding protein [Rhodococcus erythropolis]|uniref:Lsr2 family DNA-binding protein n=1 Tax=Rhodococcus erythropolis TaxID=1833 RepID=UPI003F65830D